MNLIYCITVPVSLKELYKSRVEIDRNYTRSMSVKSGQVQSVPDGSSKKNRNRLQLLDYLENDTLYVVVLTSLVHPDQYCRNKKHGWFRNVILNQGGLTNESINLDEILIDKILTMFSFLIR